MREDQREETQYSESPYSKGLFGGGGNGRMVRPYRPRTE